MADGQVNAKEENKTVLRNGWFNFKMQTCLKEDTVEQ